MPVPIEAVIATLTRARAIRASPAPQPINRGNSDRAETRLHFRATLADGSEAIVTVTPEASKLAQWQRDLARALPGLVVEPLDEWQVDGICAMAQPWFEGRPLEELAGLDPEAARQAFARATGILDAAVSVSDAAARWAEFAAWMEDIVGLPCWNAAAVAQLRENLLPRLYRELTVEPPACRWSNGDFTSSNLLVGPAGEVRLIDAEFAHRTHFHFEDAARFHVLSPCARRHPGLFTAWPRPGWAGQLFFWLRQILLEQRHNTADYRSRFLPRRLAVIRQLIEVGLGQPFPIPSVATPTITHHIEQARWHQGPEADIVVAGWCHARGETVSSVLATTAREVQASAPLLERADVAAHLGTAEARFSGFHLQVARVEPTNRIVLALQTVDGEMLPFRMMDADALPCRGPSLSGFEAWYARHDPVPVAVVTDSGPLFSILVPIYRTPRALLEACLRSVRAQHYTRWELCLVDDSGAPGEWREVAEAFVRADARIRFQARPERGGIARATNDALRLARGDFVALLDHDDELRPHALAEFARALQDRPATDALYSDEAVVTADSRPLTPFLKPAWSPEFLRGVMYVGHLLAVRTELARAVGGFDPAFDGVQDFEFMLRIGERTNRIEHVPRILYYWRQNPGSSALNGNVKGDMDARQLAAVRSHLARVGDIRQASSFGGHRVLLRAGRRTTFRRISHRAELAPAGGDHDEVVVFAAEHVSLDEDGAQELAALAALPDSGVVAPVLIAPDGRVAGAGFTTASTPPLPLMTGFDAAGDGFNGSLRCNREVGAVGPDCFAARRGLGAELLSAPDWWSALARLAAGGLRHRVCSVVHARLRSAPSPQTGTAQGTDPWFNPHFDPIRGDYSLRRPPAHFSTLRWHLDTPIPAETPDGCLDLRGWAASADDASATLWFQSGDLDWPLLCHQVRPDVNAALGRRTNAPAGFRASFRLPPGRHEASIGFDDGRMRRALWRGTIRVPASAAFQRAWRTPPEKLLACQMPAAPTDMPRALQPEIFPVPKTAPENRPRLAIVTPSFRQARFIGHTIASVLQAKTPLQYVVQDGGSDDGTREIIAAVAGRLHAWESAPDAGQADAIARGFAKTSGAPHDLMAWINSDDCYLPGALDFIADHFARHPEVDVLYGHRILIDADGREIGRWFLPPHDDAVLRLNDFVPQESLFWRRRLWDRVGGIDRAKQFALDWDLLLRFQEAGARITRVPYFLACFRVHAAQKTSARMHDAGQGEIDALRQRTQGRLVAPDELERDPRLVRYLRASARREWLWRLGLRIRT